MNEIDVERIVLNIEMKVLRARAEAIMELMKNHVGKEYLALELGLTLAQIERLKYLTR